MTDSILANSAVLILGSGPMVVVEKNEIVAGDPIQLRPAWQRGYDARMYGVVEKNSEHLPEDQILYDAGVRDAERDDQTDRDEEGRDGEMVSHMLDLNGIQGDL